MLDLLITGGTVIDGTGKPGFGGDVGIKDGRIVELGKITTPASRTIKADGRLITPGFVDLHTHFDGQVSWDSELAPSSVNGVTSVVMGNCGVGFAPVRPDRHDWLIDLLEGVEDIPGTALAEGISWEWESFPEYLDALDRRRFTIDVGAQIPHAALRGYVMGDRGREHDEHPTAGELVEMQRLTREALLAGAIGFTTSRTIAHVSRDGRTIGTLRARQAELTAIAEAVGEAGCGVIQLISDAYMDPDEAFAAAELAHIRSLAEISGRPLSFTVMQTNQMPERWRMLYAAARDMVRDGLTVRTQVAPRPVGAVQSFASTINPFTSTAAYRALAGLPFAERYERLRSPEIKQRILADYNGRELTDFEKLNPVRFDRLFPMNDPVDYEPSLEQSLAARAERAGRDVADYTYDLLLEEGGTRLLFAPTMNYAEGNLASVHEMITSDFALFGLSDAGAHVATVSDGTFPTSIMAIWAKGRQDGRTIPIEAIVHGYSQRNAFHVGWRDRGVIAPGYLADINVIDFDAVDVHQPRLVRDLPAGGSRFLQKTFGYDYTIKRGAVTVEGGQFSGELPGRLMRGAQPGV